MIQRLERFCELYGHTAVPTNWEYDVTLADWCTIQRQIGHEIQIGYRDYNTELSTEQKVIYSQLQSMNFSFTNYVEWHWNDKYDHLSQRILTPNEIRDDSISVIDSSSDAKSLYLWLNDQRRKYNSCDIESLYLWLNDQRQKYNKDIEGGTFDPQNIEKLKKFDVLF